MFIRDFGILGGDLVEDPMKETIGHLHDIVFGEAGNLLAAMFPRELEGVAHDLLAAWTRNQLEALHHIRTELVFDTGVKVFLVFPHDDHVHGRMLGLDEWVIRDARPNVGVEAEALARGDIQAFESATLWSGNWRF